MDPTEKISDTELTAVEKLEKRRNTNFGLSLSNTTYRSSIKSPERKDAFEYGGGTCSQCGASLPHDDYVGVVESKWFRVYGYNCHVCGHRWLNEKRAAEEIKRCQKYTTMSKWELKRSKMSVDGRFTGVGHKFERGESTNKHPETEFVSDIK